MLYLEASSSHCLHVSTSFLSIQSYDLGGLSIVSQGAYAPQALQAGRLPRFHYLDYPYCVVPKLMNSQVQLLLGSSR